jgi:hypothetical protein
MTRPPVKRRGRGAGVLYLKAATWRRETRRGAAAAAAAARPQFHRNTGFRGWGFGIVWLSFEKIIPHFHMNSNSEGC